VESGENDPTENIVLNPIPIVNNALEHLNNVASGKQLINY
jgi:hypothetical protein